MLDIRMIRERPDEVRAALARRGGGVERQSTRSSTWMSVGASW